MPKTAARPRSLLIGLARFIPAIFVFAAAILFDDPLVLILLLAGNALMLTAICAGIGFDMDLGFSRSVARRGLTGFVMASLYTIVVAALLAVPAWWLVNDPTLMGALGLSAALLIALLLLWRLWPAFVLPFVWDDAYPAEGRGSWLLAALRRSMAFARHLTGEHELFFSHGLMSGLSLLVISVGALAIATLGAGLAIELRISAIIVYAFVIVPLAYLTVATRCVNAMLTDARLQRLSAQRKAEELADTQARVETLPEDIGVFEASAALLEAARSGQVDRALAALERGANPDTVPLIGERDQRSVLIHAVILPDLRLLRALISTGVDVNRSHGGMAPLIAATRDSFQGRPDAIMTLLANGADPAVTDDDANTAMHHAALCGEPIVAALLLDAGVPLDAVNGEGRTALGMACANGNWPLAAFLLDRGAAVDVDHSQPALLLAASVPEDDPEGVRMLLKRKARVDARGLLDRTPLMAAAMTGHVQIAKALLGAGAQVELLDRNGANALMEAARSGAVEIIRSLGERKADPDRVDALGRTALMIACGTRAGNEETVRALLAIGADRSIVAADGRRAVDHAAASGRWPIVSLLDPAFTLPSSMAAEPVADDSRASHLLDALRFGHWNVADELRESTQSRPVAELARLYLGLIEPGHAQARDWICNLGLPPDARLDNGKLLTDALLDGLPGTGDALAQLEQRGFPIGGASSVARVLSIAPAGPEGDAMCRLAGRLMTRGADCFGRASGDAMPLHLACALGDADLVARLLESGSDVNALDSRGRMPLHYALKAPSAAAIRVSRVLIRGGADPERASANGETALGLALSRADRDLVYWLNWPRWRLPGRALRGADLPFAAAAGDIDAVDKLLGLGFSVGSVDAQGATALIRAAGSGFAALVVRLLDVGADPKQASYSGATCLSAAVAARREAVVRTLLQHGIDADQRLPGGGTPLMIAAALGLPRLAEPLLERGADPNVADDRGNTALQAAAQFAFESRDTGISAELLEMLLRHGASISARNQGGQDALLLLLGARAEPGTACDAQHLGHLATLLVEKGASVDGGDQRGVSPLHACAMHGLLGVARLLKSHDAPIDQLDTLGRSAGEIAALLGYVDVANELGVVRSAVPSARLTLRNRVKD
ncbi:ankyrin repeat domain-containing protein [Dokdonella sp.]|uniref:ankyrin repeat domain-containing protein n=1 Tax=Dokdonella sp. TaxID=2291710 RepID=UPI003C54B347